MRLTAPKPGDLRLSQRIGEHQLQLVRPQPPGLALWRQTVPVATVEKDRGSLANDPHAVLEEGRREWGRREARIARPGDAVTGANAHRSFLDDIAKGGARFLQREPNEFAAALQAWPVVQFLGSDGAAASTPLRYAVSARDPAGRSRPTSAPQSGAVGRIGVAQECRADFAGLWEGGGAAWQSSGDAGAIS